MPRVILSLVWSAMIVAALGAGRASADRGSLAAGWLAADRRAQPLTVGLAGIADRAGEGRSGHALAAELGAAFDAAMLAGGGAAALEGIRFSVRAPGTGVNGLRNLIASVEAGPRGYDAIHHSAQALPATVPTRLTIAEIRAWIAATPGQQHAIGRYQFIPSTLEMLTARLGVPAGARFSPALQDRLADELLADAGLAAFREGRLGREDFMHNLATIWAGLPVASGKSYYAGIAGNAAGMTWQDYAHRMVALFPD